MMKMKGLLKKGRAIPNVHPGWKPDPVDNKDVLAFIIAIYQLCVPLLAGLFIAGAIVSLIVLFLFR